MTCSRCANVADVPGSSLCSRCQAQTHLAPDCPPGEHPVSECALFEPSPDQIELVGYQVVVEHEPARVVEPVANERARELHVNSRFELEVAEREIEASLGDDLSPYAWFVLERMAEVQGCEPSEVLASIMFAWTSDHAAFLDGGGMSLLDFKNSKATPFP